MVPLVPQTGAPNASHWNPKKGPTPGTRRCEVSFQKCSYQVGRVADCCCSPRVTTLRSCPLRRHLYHHFFQSPRQPPKFKSTCTSQIAPKCLSKSPTSSSPTWTA